VKLAELVLFAANVVYATAYVATRATLGSIPPGCSRSRGSSSPGRRWRRSGGPYGPLRRVVGTLYLAVVISALGYVAWNWALARVPAPRAALFLNV
jgi:drug/metabolite transporter (DMT)-like permease